MVKEIAAFAIYSLYIYIFYWAYVRQIAPSLAYYYHPDCDPRNMCSLVDNFKYSVVQFISIFFLGVIIASLLLFAWLLGPSSHAAAVPALLAIVEATIAMVATVIFPQLGNLLGVTDIHPKQAS